MLAEYLAEVEADRSVDRTASDLQQLGWLSTLHLKSVWAFVPAGEPEPMDPYLDLRGWRARERDAVFALAGEAAAWHLGYVQRPFDGSTAIWLPSGVAPPHGLRPYVSVTRFRWAADMARKVGPTSKFLRAKGLDLTGWASGMPAFGPEALLVQVAARPASFRAWADLIAQLGMLVEDCEVDKVIDLLDGFSGSAWQRTAYLFDRTGASNEAHEVLRHRGKPSTSAAQFGDGPVAVWSNEFGVNDRLIAPLQDQLGKS